MQFLQSMPAEAAPLTEAAQSSDMITYLNNGGGFYLPAEAAVLLVAAAIMAVAAVIFFISAKSAGKRSDKNLKSNIERGNAK